MDKIDFFFCTVSAEGMDCVKLEDLLVEDTWLEVLPGELQKPYSKILCGFVEREARESAPIYPPPFLIFNALNSMPFERVKAVIVGQVASSSNFNVYGLFSRGKCTLMPGCVESPCVFG